jgi:leukocyte elastase inhibitor
MAKGAPLVLSAVIHKAYVDVNEKGTEAAAATAATIRATSMRGPEPEPVRFRADHPFFFVIRDNGTGSLLFAGRLVDPQAA